SKRLARFSVWHPTDQLFVEVAQAIVANDLKEAYPLLRPSFMKSGAVDFAKALAVLDPESASDDFVTYLAIAESGLAPKGASAYALEHLALYLPNPRHPMLAILIQLASRVEG